MEHSIWINSINTTDFFILAIFRPIIENAIYETMISLLKQDYNVRSYLDCA